METSVYEGERGAGRGGLYSRVHMDNANLHRCCIALTASDIPGTVLSTWGEERSVEGGRSLRTEKARPSFSPNCFLILATAMASSITRVDLEYYPPDTHDIHSLVMQPKLPQGAPRFCGSFLRYYHSCASIAQLCIGPRGMGGYFFQLF